MNYVLQFIHHIKMKITNNEVDMTPCSDDSLRGQIALRNHFHDHSIIFKIKSTNSSLFETDNSKGLIPPNEEVKIIFTTSRAINSDLAKEIALKHKFLVEYVLTGKKVSTFEEGADDLRGPTVQYQKIYINTNSVRTSRVKSGKNSQIGSSNKFDFHSMIGRGGERKIQEPSSKLQRLKKQTQNLQLERASLLNANQSPRGGTGIGKKAIIFILILIISNLLSKWIGLPDLVKPKEEQKIEESESFWDVFNFGGDEEEVEEESQGFFQL